MLILTRRPDESVHIGNDIVLTVLGIKGNQVRLGIQAPKDIVIDREEVHRRKQREHTLNVTVTPIESPIGSAASESRAFNSPSASESVTNPVAGLVTDLQQTLGTAQAAANAVRSTAGDLFEFHAALVDVRTYLEPLRDRVLHYEDDLSNLYWARAASGPGVDAALAVVRAHKHLLNDLLFCLPHHRLRRGTHSIVNETSLT